MMFPAALLYPDGENFVSDQHGLDVGWDIGLESQEATLVDPKLGNEVWLIHEFGKCFEICFRAGFCVHSDEWHFGVCGWQS